MNEEYIHYKGGKYKVITIAVHTESGEKLVIYQDEEKNSYARPYKMFYDLVEINGKKIPRFKKINS